MSKTKYKSPQSVGQDCDQTLPFLLERSGIRGRAVRLDKALKAVLASRPYPQKVAREVGEALVLTALLSSLVKFEGIFTTQIKSEGALRMIVTDLTDQGHLRGTATWDEAKLSAADGFETLYGKGYLAYTVDQGGSKDRYQGIVALSGESLTDSLRHYFRQSEQIQSGLFVAVAPGPQGLRAAGIALQYLPEDKPQSNREAVDPEAREEHWRHAMVLLSTVTPGELLDGAVPLGQLVYRLFHEDGVRVYETRSLIAQCRCDGDRLAALLARMAPEEIEHMTLDGEIEASCEFCGKVYRFDPHALSSHAVSSHEGSHKAGA